MDLLPTSKALYSEINYLIDQIRIVTIKFYGKYSNMIRIIYIQLAKQQKPNCKDLQFGFYLQYIHNSIFAGFCILPQQLACILPQQLACILPQQLALVLDFHHYTFFNAIWRVVGNFINYKPYCTKNPHFPNTLVYNLKI